MLRSVAQAILNRLPATQAAAHRDGPCGVYDLADVAAEAVLSMTKKLIALAPPEGNDAAAWATYNNTFSRYVAVKEEQAQETKRNSHWTDYFAGAPGHLPGTA